MRSRTRQVRMMAAAMSTHTFDTHAVKMMAMNRRNSWGNENYTGDVEEGRERGWEGGVRTKGKGRKEKMGENEKGREGKGGKEREVETGGSQLLTSMYIQNCKGRRSSRNPMSLEKRFKTLPIGLVSKNRMGANMRLGRIHAALTHTKKKAMVHVRFISTACSQHCAPIDAHPLVCGEVTQPADTRVSLFLDSQVQA